MSPGSDSLGAIGILALVVFGGSYIIDEVGILTLPFTVDIMRLVLMGLAVIVIAVTVYANLRDY